MILIILTQEQRKLWENKLAEGIGISACFDYVVDLSEKNKIQFYKSRNFRRTNKVVDSGNLLDFMDWLVREVRSQAGRLL